MEHLQAFLAEEDGPKDIFSQLVTSRSGPEFMSAAQYRFQPFPIRTHHIRLKSPGLQALANSGKLREQFDLDLSGSLSESEAANMAKAAEDLGNSNLSGQDAEPPGAVLFLHGVKQHSKGPEVLQIAKRIVTSSGALWYAWDMQGHGRSGQLGDPSHIVPPATVVSGESVVADAFEFVRVIVEETHPGINFVLAGHSFGGGMALSMVPALQEKYGDRFRGFVLSAPAGFTVFDLPGMKFPMPAPLLAAFMCASKCFPEFIIKGAKVAELKKSVRRASALGLLEADKSRHQAGELPIGTMFSGMPIFAPNKDPSHMMKIKVPFHMSHGSADQTNLIHVSKLLYALASTPDENKSLQIFLDAKHNLLADLWRVTEFVDSWAGFVGKALASPFGRKWFNAGPSLPAGAEEIKLDDHMGLKKLATDTTFTAEEWEKISFDLKKNHCVKVGTDYFMPATPVSWFDPEGAGATTKTYQEHVTSFDTANVGNMSSDPKSILTFKKEVLNEQIKAAQENVKYLEAQIAPVTKKLATMP